MGRVSSIVAQLLTGPGMPYHKMNIVSRYKLAFTGYLLGSFLVAEHFFLENPRHMARAAQ